jgi:hypothetical protein
MGESVENPTPTPLSRLLRRRVAKNDIKWYKRLKKMQVRAKEYQEEFARMDRLQLEALVGAKMSDNKKRVLNWYLEQLDKPNEDISDNGGNVQLQHDNSTLRGDESSDTPPSEGGG